MIYPRRLTQTLINEITTPQIVLLTGMRQTGKTTLMRQIYDSVESKNKAFLDLENPLTQKVFEEENFDNILLNLKEFGINPKEKIFLFIDEIQLMPKLSSAIKYLYDHYKIKFFLTGSSSFYLKGLFPESLAGRKIIYELFPLDFGEFLVFKEKEKFEATTLSQKAMDKNKVSFELYKRFYDEYLSFGGFPQVVIEEDKERKKRLLQDIFTSYFEKDVKTLSDFKDIRILRDLILLLAVRCGSRLEISKISSQLGISRDTVYSYLAFLEGTYFISLIYPYSKSRNSEVRGARKVYFPDVGLLNYLGKVEEGVIFENAVFQNIRRYGKINYYQRYKGAEIDFILNERIALEVKTFGDKKDISKLAKFASNLGLKEYYLITKNYLEEENAIICIDL